MHGLKLSRGVRGALGAVYIITALVVYGQRGWLRINEIVRIPLIEYALVFLLAGIVGGGLWLLRRWRGTRAVADTQETPV